MAARLNLLGGFELFYDGERLALPLSAQRLLAFVALRRRPVMRIFVAGTLWLDMSEDRSAANLRSTLWRLHRLGHALVDATPSHLRLADGVAVDVLDALEASQRALREPGDGDSLARDDLSGDLLPDWYDDWVGTERERLRQLRVHALEAVGEQLLEARRYAQAIDACMLAIRMDPLRESTQRLLIRIHLAEGNGSDALRQARVFARRLDSELGLEPSERLGELVAQLTER